jgi:hypothetical protein
MAIPREKKLYISEDTEAITLLVIFILHYDKILGAGIA